MFKDEAKVLYL